MRCKGCPVWGLEYYKRTGKSLCFCVCHPTTQVKPDDECQYGIQDYEVYIRELEGSEAVQAPQTPQRRHPL